jgi:pimeloyl-ACP methyl ester carboxylesterase
MPTSPRARRRRRILRSYVELPAGQVHVRSSPGTAPAIVFLHQTASSSSSFERVMQRIALPNRLVALDTPGFGGSFDPPGWPTIARYAGWLVATLDRLGVRRAHLFGHHTGTNLAAEIARRHPRRAASLMLLGPAVMSAAERREFRPAFERPIAPREDGSHLVENWNYARRYNPACPLETVHEEVVNMTRAWRGRAQAYRAVSYHDLGALLRRSALPLLLLSSREDYFFPRLAQLQALRPDARVALVGGENFPTQVDPAGVAAAITRFLTTLKAADRP